jgi:galactose mutarotase-like enzyme
MSLESSDWLHLDSGQLRVAVDPQGAQLSILQDARGRHFLWDGNPAFWSGRAPILFPIVGALNGDEFRWRGRTYSLAKHGFARRRRFEVASVDANAARFRLRPDDETRAVYPFEFELDVDFVLCDNALNVTATARNTGADVMPASLGFHPAFRWPLPGGSSRATHVIDFEHAEPAPIRRLDSAGLLKPDALPTPLQGSQLSLRDDLFEADALIFDHLASRRVRYHGETGPRITVSFPDATHLGIWTKPGAGYVCIEPWHGVADRADFTGEFDTKPGVHVVQPHSELVLTMVIEVEP